MSSIKNHNEDEIDIILNELLKNRIIQCNKCGHDCKIRIKNKNTYKRCQFKLCRKEESFFKNTIFYNKHLTIYQILQILKMWFSKMHVSSIAELTKISQKTISCYLKKALKHIETTYLETLEMIRGPGIIFEIDESKFGRRKYYRGHKVEGVWVLGMVERTLRRRIILTSLENRKSQTLTNIIKKYVHPESFIYTDCWKGYSGIKKEFASHKTVNHSVTFVDFINNVHTNTIERNWDQGSIMFCKNIVEP